MSSKNNNKTMFKLCALVLMSIACLACDHNHTHTTTDGDHERKGPAKQPSTEKPKTSTPEIKGAPGVKGTPEVKDIPKQHSSPGEKVLVCYHGSWSVYRPEQGKFMVEDIDPFLCTHVIYTFTGLGHDNRIRPLDPWNDLKDNYGKGAFERFVSLKKKNSNLKTLIAIGGWNEGSMKYSAMAASKASRKIFIDSCVGFLDKYGFDGLDMDWEYPAARGGQPSDKENFVLLLKELKEAFTGKKYLLTAAVSAGKWHIDPAYNIPEVSKYLDLINVMAYDYHGGWEDKTGHNAPLYPRPDENGNDRLSNLNFSVNYWIAKGAPKEKIVLGMGTYGRAFTLQRSEINGFGAPAPQKGQAGPYTREPGTLGYNEICEMQKSQKWTVVRDPYHLAPYAYNDRQWVGYDDVESITLKTKFAKYHKLAGAMIWSIETDDFKGICGDKFPLLNAIKSELRNPIIELPKPQIRESDHRINKTTVSPSTMSTTKQPITELQTKHPTTAAVTSGSQTEVDSSTATQSTSTVSPPTSTSTNSPMPNTATLCKSSGMFRDPNDCKKFYHCVEGLHGTFRIYQYDCPSATVFDNNMKVCIWPHSVPECSHFYTKNDVKSENFIH